MKKELLTIFVLILFPGCSSVKFYSDATLKEETGLKVCQAKPFILADYSAGKEKPAKISLIWLPDESDPQYVILKPGIGSNDLKIDLDNGMLNTLGFSSESQLPETLNSLASLISKSADAAAGFALSSVTASEADENPVFELYEIVVEKDKSILRRVNVMDDIK
jgi:hypothetical protein